jgi:hypothetical protein
LKHREGREHREEKRGIQNEKCRMQNQDAAVPILSSSGILCVLCALCVSNLHGSRAQLLKGQ